jgi:hypothetical protein
VPFGLDEDEAERYKVLVDGVPPKLREPIVAWFKHLLSSGDYERLNNARTRHLEMLTDLRMGIPENVYAKWGEYTKLLREMDGHALLKVVDAALSSQWYGTRAKELDDTLKLSKSKWMVGERFGKPGLVAREPEGVQDMVEATIASSGTAGQILARAWGQGPRLYARRPWRVCRRRASRGDGCPQDRGAGQRRSHAGRHGRSDSQPRRLAASTAGASARADRRDARGDDAVALPWTRRPARQRRLPRRHPRGGAGWRGVGRRTRVVVRLGRGAAPP